MSAFTTPSGQTGRDAYVHELAQIENQLAAVRRRAELLAQVIRGEVPADALAPMPIPSEQFPDATVDAPVASHAAALIDACLYEDAAAFLVGWKPTERYTIEPDGGSYWRALDHGRVIGRNFGSAAAASQWIDALAADDARDCGGCENDEHCGACECCPKPVAWRQSSAGLRGDVHVRVIETATGRVVVNASPVTPPLPVKQARAYAMRWGRSGRYRIEFAAAE